METSKRKKLFNANITAVGMYLPERILDNHYFEKIVETSDEWIVSRTGIKERRKEENGATSDMAARAAMDLLNSKNLSPEEIDVIIVATVTPDMFFPATACLVQDKIGAKNAWGFDLSAACSGFLFALQTGAGLIEGGTYKKVLVIGADKMSTIIIIKIEIHVFYLVMALRPYYWNLQKI
jgi:3-oxoacyl-[acyl-carrier-protein] synthase III